MNQHKKKFTADAKTGEQGQENSICFHGLGQSMQNREARVCTSHFHSKIWGRLQGGCKLQRLFIMCRMAINISFIS